MIFPAAAKEVFCFFELDYSLFLEEGVNTCLINQTIDSDAYVLGSPLDNSVEQVFVNKTNEITDLPRNIGEKFTNLKNFGL